MEGSNDKKDLEERIDNRWYMGLYYNIEIEGWKKKKRNVILLEV